MIIDSLTVAYFLSFGPKQGLDLGGKGLVFVDGENRDEPKARSNGAGKSALLEALVWCLTGKTIRGLKGDAVIHRKVGKGCDVATSGRVAPSNVAWRVRRYRKVDRKSGLEFYFDGRDLTQADTAATQALIERTLGVNFTLLTNTIVFGQGDRWRFAALPDAPRKALLDQLVGAQTLVQAHATAVAECKRIGNDADRLDAQILGYKARSDILKESIATVLDEEKKRLATVARHLREALAQVKADIEEAKPAVGGAKDASRRLKSAEHRLMEAKGDVITLTAQLARHSDMESAERVEYATLNRQMREYTGTIESVKSLDKGKPCHTCGAPISESRCDQYIVSLGVECNALERKLNKAKRVLERASAVVSATRSGLRNAEKDVTFQEKHVKTYEKRVLAADRLAELIDERTKVRDALADLKKKRAETPPAAKRLKGELEKIEVKRERLLKERALVGDDLAYRRFWVNGFGNAGVKSHLLDHVVPLLNRRAAKYSRYLTDWLTIEFDTESATKKGELRDRFDISVYNESGADVYLGNSGGEQRKADIVIARALQSLEEDKLSCNVAWWDEVFESLDETSCEAVMGLLRDEACSRSSVFVVSHLDWLRPFFPRVLHVVKEGGFTRLEWGA